MKFNERFCCFVTQKTSLHDAYVFYHRFTLNIIIFEVARAGKASNELCCVNVQVCEARVSAYIPEVSFHL